MQYDRIVFSGHAIQRMFDRGIRARDVEGVISSGEIIASYPEDTPFPSCLILGFVQAQPVHVVAAADRSSGTCYVVTVYRPDPELWDEDFRRRRST